MLDHAMIKAMPLVQVEIEAAVDFALEANLEYRRVIERATIRR